MDVYKIKKSKSKMMEGIGQDLKNVGPMSLKNLNLLQQHQRKTLYMDKPFSQQMQRTHQQKFNLNENMSTASFKDKEPESNYFGFSLNHGEYDMAFKPQSEERLESFGHHEQMSRK